MLAFSLPPYIILTVIKIELVKLHSRDKLGAGFRFKAGHIFNTEFAKINEIIL